MDILFCVIEAHPCLKVRSSTLRSGPRKTEVHRTSCDVSRSQSSIFYVSLRSSQSRYLAIFNFNVSLLNSIFYVIIIEALQTNEKIIAKDVFMKQFKLNPHLKSNVRLQDGIILVFLIFLLFTLTMTVMLGSIETNQNQMEMFSENLEVYSKNQETHFLHYIDNKVSFLKGLTQYPQINQMIPHQQRSFLKNKSEEFGFDHIYVVDTAGTGYYFDQGKYKNHSNDSFFKDIIYNDVFIQEPVETENGLTYTFSVSIYNNEDMKKGALCGVVLYEDIATIFADTTLPLQGQSFLLNRQGQYLVSEDSSKVSNHISIYEEKKTDVSLIEQAFEEKTNKSGIIRLRGVEYVACITYLPNQDWIIVQCIDNNEIQKEIRFLNLWKICSFVVIILIVFCIIKIVVYWKQSVTKLNTDPLTKCNSRIAIQSFMEQLEHEYNRSIALIYFDLNKFKYVNDTYGHDEGDKILVIFSKVLMDVFKNYGKVGRLGGDEFLAIALDVNETQLEELSNKVNEKLQKKSKELKLPYEVSTSYGYALRPQGNNTILYDVMKKADKNMYQYKQKVHNRDASK